MRSGIFRNINFKRKKGCVKKPLNTDLAAAS